MTNQSIRILSAFILILLAGGTILFLLSNLFASILAVVMYISAVGSVLYYWKFLRVETPGLKRTESVKIVAIDDEADILRLIRIKLSKEGFSVVTASNGIDGIEKVLAERPDVIIVDVMMPGKDGYQVVSEVKKKMGDAAPVAIMLTSKAEDQDMVQGLSAGADDYITKPFSPRELVERINVALIKGKKAAS
jgi:CheY-like chemotaxis protein